MELFTAVLVNSAVLAMAGSASPEQLTCNYPWGDDPGASHQFTVAGSEVEMTYGATDKLSLVGTRFILALPGQPDTAIDLCEARSAAGAGWQHTEFTGAHDGSSFISNQAAGNAIGYQWGFSSKVKKHESADLGYIEGLDWLPTYYDTFNADSGHKATSPCEGNSEFFNYLKRTVSATPQDDHNGGQVIRFTHNTKLKSTTDQSWAWTHKVDAFYFDKAKARAAGMAVFIQGESGWRVGPIFPYDPWTEDDIKDQNGVLRGRMIGTSGLGGIGSRIDEDVEQVTFCVSVGDQRIAFGMRDLPAGFDLKVEETTYCSDASDDACGNISLLAHQSGVPDATIPEGTLREFELTWEIGTTTQLRELGFWCY